MVIPLYGSSPVIKYGRECHLPTPINREKREISHVSKVINRCKRGRIEGKFKEGIMFEKQVNRIDIYLPSNTNH